MAAVPRMLAVCAIAVIGLVGAGPALGASPQRIYEDLADNGRLDGKYARADIARALDLQQVTGTDVRRPAASAPSSRPEKRTRNGLPFTGLDLALLTLVGGPLLAVAVGLRYRLAVLGSRRVGVIRS